MTAPLKVPELIRKKAKRATDPAGREVSILEDEAVFSIARSCGREASEIYAEALGLGTCPARYLRNRETLSLQEQLKLAESQVAVVGAGGLGGQVIEILARIGVGRIVVVDSDRFDETNLNRQTFCTRQTLGKEKAHAAREAVAAVNPGVRVKAHSVRLDASNAAELLSGSDVVVDALDNVPDRLLLEQTAQYLGVPLVHGALAGFEGQLAVVFPGDKGLKQLYGEGGTKRKNPRSPEAVLGVPSVTPFIVASLQAMEVVKILLNRGRTFRHRMTHLDLESGAWHEFILEEP